MGVDPNSILRVKEGIIYVLNQLTSEGHVYYPLEPLLAKAAEMLKVDAELTGKAVAELLEERRIRVEELPGQPPLQAVYLPAFYTAETNLARLLLSLAGELFSPSVPLIQKGQWTGLPAKSAQIWPKNRKRLLFYLRRTKS